LAAFWPLESNFPLPNAIQENEVKLEAELESRRAHPAPLERQARLMRFASATEWNQYLRLKSRF
jgi:hypothetical protein